MKNSKKKSIFKELKECWNRICLKDRCLLFIMLILLLSSIHNLFTPPPPTTDAANIDVIVRTTMAGIFGYFLSANFLNGDCDKCTTKSENDNIKNKICNDYDNSIKPMNFLDLDNTSPLPKNFNRYLYNKNLQMLIATIICLISITVLLIAKDFNFLSNTVNPTVVQFRDFISACIGFLLGNPTETKK